MENVFREALENGEFVVTCEMIPGRGAFEAYQEADHMKMRAIWETGLVHAISITDCPSGNPAISPPTVARRFAREGIPSIVHYTCKDRSRNMMQGELYAMQLRDLENLLIMSGDYQGSGFEGAGRPDFDLDPANALRLVSAMNEGLVYHGRDGDVRETPAHFFPGAVVNPYKYREGESIPQYLKLEKKLICGARFIIQQLGFDARKMQEQLFYVAERGYDVPMIANVFMLTKTAASLMRRGDIAGCIVTDKLMAELEEESDANALRPGYARGKRIAVSYTHLSVASSPLFGMLSDKTGKTKWLLVFCLFFLGPCTFVLYNFEGAVMWIGAVVMGVIGMGTTGLMITAFMKVISRPELATIGMGVLICVQGIGQFLGTFLVQGLLGPSFENTLLAGSVVMVIGLVGTLCTALCKMR